MEKKVLIISYQYPPCASSGVFRTLRFIKNLPEFGWVPIVLTMDHRYYDNEPLDFNLIEQVNKTTVYKTKSLPGFDRWISFLRKLKPKSKAAVPGNTQVKAKAHQTSQKPSTALQNLKDAITLSLMIPDKQNGWLPYAVFQGLKAIREAKAELIYASGRPWTAFMIGVILKRLTGFPLIIDFRDPWMDNPYILHNFLLKDKINAALEKLCIAKADIVIANTEPLRKLFLEKYQKVVNPNKFFTITNGYDDTEFSSIDNLAIKKDTNQPFVISHIGTLYSKRSPENFFMALSYLIQEGKIPSDKIKVVCVGRSDIDGLTDLLNRENLSEIVEFKGHIPKKQALTIAAESDLLLLLQPDTPLQIPAKLFEYIRLRKPILAICGPGATKDIVISNNFGAVADYNNINNIKDRLLDLYHSHIDQNTKLVIADKNVTLFNSFTLTSKLVALFDNAGNSVNTVQH